VRVCVCVCVCVYVFSRSLSHTHTHSNTHSPPSLSLSLSLSLSNTLSLSSSLFRAFSLSIALSLSHFPLAARLLAARPIRGSPPQTGKKNDQVTKLVTLVPDPKPGNYSTQRKKDYDHGDFQHAGSALRNGGDSQQTQTQSCSWFDI